MERKLNLKQSFLAGLFAGIVAAIINSVLFFTFRGIGIITDNIEVQPGQPMNAAAIILSSFVPSLLAGLVFYLFEKYTKNGYKIFSIVSIMLLLLSFSNPFMMIKNVPLYYALALDFMHIIVVSSILFFLKRSKKSPEERISLI